MDVTSVLFYAFSAILLFSAFKVVTSRNTVHATLYLMLAFFQASMVWMLMRAEFLAITLVLVYLGAVMVLFLFVVMMLDIDTESMRQGFWRHLPLAALVGALMAGEISIVLMDGFSAMPAPGPESRFTINQLASIATIVKVAQIAKLANIPGQTLVSKIKRRTPFSVGEARKINRVFHAHGLTVH